MVTPPSTLSATVSELAKNLATDIVSVFRHGLIRLFRMGKRHGNTVGNLEILFPYASSVYASPIHGPYPPR